MTQIIWLSDLHFAATGDVMGLNPQRWLRGAVDRINAQYSDADFCVISGDLVNHGTAQDYDALRRALDRLALPYYPMVGNHDDRGELARALPLPAARMPGFVQYAIERPLHRILCLDTLLPGASAGAFCAQRLQWLADELAKDARPAYLFMHHPPLALGLPMQDRDNLRDAKAFLDVVTGSGVVAHLFLGHVHRPVTGVVRGIPFATMRSTLLQAPPPRPAWDWDSFKPAQDAPAFGVIEIGAEAMTMQYIDFAQSASD